MAECSDLLSKWSCCYCSLRFCSFRGMDWWYFGKRFSLEPFCSPWWLWRWHRHRGAFGRTVGWRWHSSRGPSRCPARDRNRAFQSGRTQLLGGWTAEWKWWEEGLSRFSVFLKLLTPLSGLFILKSRHYEIFESVSSLNDITSKEKIFESFQPRSKIVFYMRINNFNSKSV